LSRAATILLAVPGCVAALWIARDHLPQSVREKVCPPCAAARRALEVDVISTAHSPKCAALLDRLALSSPWSDEDADLASRMIADPATFIAQEAEFHPALRRDVLRLAITRLDTQTLPSSARASMVTVLSRSLDDGTPQWRTLVMNALKGSPLISELPIRDSLQRIAATDRPRIVADLARDLLATTQAAPP
jgi:hypothetical protein